MSTSTTMIGVIGGSGIYEIDGLEGAEWVDVETPWGAPSDQILTGSLGGVAMAFLPRHGRGHVHAPTTVPYRANIDALKRLGVTDVVSVSACGSFREEMAPGDFVIVEPGKVLIGYCGERSEKEGSEQVAEFVRNEGVLDTGPRGLRAG